MNRAIQTIWVFSWYLLVLGLSLLIAPNLLLGLFGLPTTSEVWIRVVGMLALLLALYYYTAAKHHLTPMLEASITGRSFVMLCFTAFVLLGVASPVLFLFGLVDLLGAVWTRLALRTERLELSYPKTSRVF